MPISTFTITNMIRLTPGTKSNKNQYQGLPIIFSIGRKCRTGINPGSLKVNPLRFIKAGVVAH
jgi:hypothetical protein